MTPDDVSFVFKDVSAHRIILASKARLSNQDLDAVLKSIIEGVMIPKINNKVVL